MAKKKISRKELLKKPDEFLTFSARAILYARQHAGKLKLLGAVVVAAILVYAGTNTYLKYVDKKGQETYNAAYNRLIKGLQGEKPNLEELAKSEQLFRKVMDEYGLSKSSGLALAELGYIKFTKGEYDEAISLYSSYMEEISGDWYYKSLAILALGACYEAKGDVRKAVDVLEPTSAGPGSFLKGQAMLGLSRLYELMGRDDRAEKVLEEFSEMFPSSPYLPFVRARLNSYDQ
ncbi:MAG: tetratricopeptide repeat protein [Deltaproteobacteria bacterium]|nr:tetratricopeptide repeat protein [Deltaproteobacteria bacterium]